MADDLVAASRASIEKGSKSFALASKLFDPVHRGRATLLYAWCRYADDVIDGQDAGHGRIESTISPVERLIDLESRTKEALCLGRHPGGRRDLSRPDWVPAFAGMTAQEAMPFAALARVAAETGMPDRYPLDLIEGFRSDVEERAFGTFDDTLTYCYHVAGCVGVMMAIVMGVSSDDRATLDRACDLGLAFQLNNIARDVVEDAANGRCYLPEAWLAEAGLSSGRHPREGGDDVGEYFAAPHNRAALATVVARLVDAAERYEASSRFGTPALARRAAWAVLAAADIYGGIGRRVRSQGAEALGRRVTTSRADKLWAVARTLPLSFSRSKRWPAPGPSRAGLWTMP